MPDIENLMQEWPSGFEEALNEVRLNIIISSLDTKKLLFQTCM